MEIQTDSKAINVVRALVRPVVTIMFAGAFVYMAVIGKIEPDVFTTVVMAVVLWWFKTRDQK